MTTEKGEVGISEQQEELSNDNVVDWNSIFKAMNI